MTPLLEYTTTECLSAAPSEGITPSFTSVFRSWLCRGHQSLLFSREGCSGDFDGERSLPSGLMICSEIPTFRFGQIPFLVAPTRSSDSLMVQPAQA